MSTNDHEIKIFKLNRIKFQELYKDAVDYIKASYKAVGQKFNTASPFGQILQVVLHLGRMIFYYIEDSITGLNIKTAYRPDQIKGLARLAGHDAARTIAARGAVRITYYDNGDPNNTGAVCYIPNKTKVATKLNGYVYTLFFGADNGRISMHPGNYIDATVIQGEIKMQTATGTGQELQSYNFAERNFAEVDQYYINIYVNGEAWDVVPSIQDLGYMQKGCVVKTGINSGIDVYFGTGVMGAIPPDGSQIIAEYIVADGSRPNVTKEFANSSDYWQFIGEGFLPDGSSINLNQHFKITCQTDIIFGTEPEDTALTQIIAPHASRSFVLANEINYEYFFKKMNMFSAVEIIRGSYTINGTSIMQLAYNQAFQNYEDAQINYKNACDTWGEFSNEAQLKYKEMLKQQRIMNYAATKLSDNTYRDNTVYILLIPDITKRISSAENYFTCDESLFYLSKDEQENIINLINASGQRIITVENRILDPKVTRFAVNIKAKIWENYDEEQVYAAGLNALSEYFLTRERKDMIPRSDIIALFETKVPGIDSVQVTFVADVDNQDIYGPNNYGIDEYGDILLTRTIIDSTGQVQKVRDILPLIRGGFTGTDSVEYDSVQTKDGNSAYNLEFYSERSSADSINLTKYTPLT